MPSAIVYDCEYLTAQGAQGRFWNGPHDPDPLVVQIGAVRLSLEEGFDIGDRFEAMVRPLDRFGREVAPDPFFTRLTGIGPARVAEEGRPLAEALADFDAFSEGAGFWSWGKDELNLMGVSCYIAGFPPPIPARRFGNVCRLTLAAGMPLEDVERTRSNTLAGYFGLQVPDARAHDAVDDAMSVAVALQHLLREGRLAAADFA